MKRLVGVAVIILSVSLIVLAQTSTPAPSSRAEQAIASDDRALEARIHDQLNMSDAMRGVKLAVNSGVADLSGTVVTKQDRKQAEKLVRAVPGVKSVKNHITVDSNAGSRPTSNAPRYAESANSSEANGQSAQNQNTQSQSQNQPASNTRPEGDATTAGAANPSATTNESSEKGALTTTPGSAKNESPAAAPAPGSGTTTSTDAQAATPGNTGAGYSGLPQHDHPASPGKQSAQPSAQAAGTQPATGNPPVDLNGGDTAALQNTIQTTLRNDPIAGGNNITVNVTSNTIELNGTAANGKAKTTAYRIAESYALNRSVVDHVTVTGRGNTATGTTVGASGATTPAANTGVQPTKQQNQPATKVPK